ncbi:hypothetical protein TNCV_2415811 [Trichonephila clavipes]|nr:hypothetical protein TNCV_2415811 [Trichonephila clavipes]
MIKCYQWVTDQDTVQVRATIEYPAFRGKSEHDVPRVVWHYIVGRCLLAGLKDRTQSLVVSEMHRSAFKLTSIETRDVSAVCTKWLSKPSHHVKGLYADIECKYRRQAISTEPPDTYTAIRILYVEPGLV